MLPELTLGQSGALQFLCNTAQLSNHFLLIHLRSPLLSGEPPFHTTVLFNIILILQLLLPVNPGRHCAGRAIGDEEKPTYLPSV
jgi:hypothetical protein